MANRHLTQAWTRALAHICLLIALTAPHVAHASGAKPLVLVGFEIAVPEFQRNLPELAQAEATIGMALAKIFASNYAFADWQTTIGNGSAVQLAQLLVRLEKDDNTRPGPQVFIRLYGALPGGGTKLLHLQPIEIYAPSFLNWDTNNRRDFEARVLSKALAKINTTEFQKEFFSNFLTQVPIATAVLPSASERVIDIPVPWSQNMLAPESVLAVRFDKQVQQARLKGTVTLSNITDRIDPAPAGAGTGSVRLRGSVTTAVFDTKSLPLDADNWNSRLPDLLRGAKTTCVIAVYKDRDALSAGDDSLLELP